MWNCTSFLLHINRTPGFFLCGYRPTLKEPTGPDPHNLTALGRRANPAQRYPLRKEKVHLKKCRFTSSLRKARNDRRIKNSLDVHVRSCKGEISGLICMSLLHLWREKFTQNKTNFDGGFCFCFSVYKLCIVTHHRCTFSVKVQAKIKFAHFKDHLKWNRSHQEFFFLMHVNSTKLDNSEINNLDR